MLNTHTRTVYENEHEIFRDQVRKFFGRHALPNLDRWEKQGIVDREFWLACGEAALLCPTMPETYGGQGTDFRYNAVIDEELSYVGVAAGIVLQSDVTAEYILRYGSEEQRHTWLPKMISGEVITAIAMTEPGAGSDLQGIKTTARREGEGYILNGSKTYITNGQNADLIIVVARTGADLGAKSLSLILVESTRAGFARGRNLDKIGQHCADTSELFFNDVHVPLANCIGAENKAFGYLMNALPQERLSIAVCSQAAAQRAFDEAVAYTKDRKAFGKTIFDLQNTRFTLADLATRLQVGWAHLDWAIRRHLSGSLDAAQASAAKLYHTELHWLCCDAALQLHGGAGYMNEYPIARLWRDARVTRIFGGTSEIMKEIIGRSL
jgi:acyl-CoA dehydrogenase